MLKFPAQLTPETFLEPLLAKAAAVYASKPWQRSKPAITPDELGWLATLDDVESRIVFVDRDGARPVRYRAESGPFDDAYLRGVAERKTGPCWYYDVEKAPARKCGHVFQLSAVYSRLAHRRPDGQFCNTRRRRWAAQGQLRRISLPGRRHTRHWTIHELCRLPTTRRPAKTWPCSSDFDGEQLQTPKWATCCICRPASAHYGTAADACMTYSIGMRAPQLSDLQ